MFVELTDKQTNLKLSINRNHIVTVWEINDYCGIDTVINKRDTAIYVKESYQKVMKLINW